MSRRFSSVVILLALVTAGRLGAAESKPREPTTHTKDRGALSVLWEWVLSAVVAAPGSGIVASPPERTDAGWQMDPNGGLVASLSLKP